MSEEIENLTIEAISTKTNSIMSNDIWYPVIGNAVNYLSKYKKDDNIKVKIVDGKVTYITPITESKPKSEEIKDKPIVSPYDHKQDLILAQSTLKEAVQLAIANNKPFIQNVKDVHKELFKYMKEEGYK